VFALLLGKLKSDYDQVDSARGTDDVRRGRVVQRNELIE
jgi:hypothetical protein